MVPAVVSISYDNRSPFMKIDVAGFNIDRSISDRIEDRSIVTPETLSAAYARISRSPKAITGLRTESINEVDRARKSNQSIIFEMGHSSVAEHAVFNFDLIGVSRYFSEFIQRTRLASFTEKSQRYVTLDGDYVTPQEIVGSDLENEFHDLIEQQNELYFQLYESQRAKLIAEGFPGKKRELEGAAKEDARYVLSLATKSQMGMTINCRSLQRLLRRLSRVDLLEAKELKDKLEQAAKSYAPSLIRYTEAGEFETGLSTRLPEIETKVPQEAIRLIAADDHPDERVLAALIFEQSGGDFQAIFEELLTWEPERKRVLFDRLFEGLQSFDTMPRGFEIAEFTMQVRASSSCYAQWKRHRTSTILLAGRTDYFVIPPVYTDEDILSRFTEVMKASRSMAEKLGAVNPLLRDYAMTNAHETVFVFKANLRELYHFSRLRSDDHAQWEIRQLSKRIDAMIHEMAPLSASKMMGKSEFPK